MMRWWVMQAVCVWGGGGAAGARRTASWGAACLHCCSSSAPYPSGTSLIYIVQCIIHWECIIDWIMPHGQSKLLCCTMTCTMIHALYCAVSWTLHVCLCLSFHISLSFSNQCISGSSDRWVWTQIETSLAAAATGSGAVAGRPAPTLLIQQALEAIARISKGFNANLCTRVRPEIGKLLLSIGLDVCMALDSTQQLCFQDSSCTPW